MYRLHQARFMIFRTQTRNLSTCLGFCGPTSLQIARLSQLPVYLWTEARLQYLACCNRRYPSSAFNSSSQGRRPSWGAGYAGGPLRVNCLTGRSFASQPQRALLPFCLVSTCANSVYWVYILGPQDPHLVYSNACNLPASVLRGIASGTSEERADDLGRGLQVWKSSLCYSEITMMISAKLVPEDSLRLHQAKSGRGRQLSTTTMLWSFQFKGNGSVRKLGGCIRKPGALLWRI